MGIREKFDEANTTLDGRLTKAQAQAAGMTQVVANFAAIDTQGAGYVSFDQVKGFKAQKKARLAKVQQTRAKVAQRNVMTGKGDAIQDRFEKANTTGDGKLTKQQVEAAGNKSLLRYFDQIDTEGKGYLTSEQVRAFSERMRVADKADRKPRVGGVK